MYTPRFLGTGTWDSSRPFRGSFPSLPGEGHLSSPTSETSRRGFCPSSSDAGHPYRSALYPRELMTTFGLIHTLHYDADELDAELRGCTSFRDPRTLVSPRLDTRPSSSSTSAVTTPMTAHDQPPHLFDSGHNLRSTTTTRPVHGITVATTTCRASSPLRPQRCFGPFTFSLTPEPYS